MNRITRMKAVRRGTVAAATIAALVASGAAVAGASGNGATFNAHGAITRNHAGHDANHDHGHRGIHQIEGLISSVAGSTGALTSMVVNTRENGTVTVNFTATTAFSMNHQTLTLATVNLVIGERVNVTPVPGSTLASFTAASVRIQVPEIHQIEGVISSLNGPAGSPTSMIVTTRQNTQVTVSLTSSPAVTMEHASGPLTLANLATGERVSVTPTAGSTLASFTAASVRIQVPEIHQIEGVVYSANGLTSMVVTTPNSGQVTVNFGPSTTVTMEHASGLLTPANLIAGERVNVTPSSTSTPGSFVAASIQIQVPEVHHIEGTIASFETTNSLVTSMVVNTPNSGAVTVNFGSSTVITMEHASGSMTPANLIVGERVNVTPTSTSTPTSFVAASVRIQIQDK